MTLTVEAEIVPLKQDIDGVIRVSSTRVPLETIITAFLEGDTAEEIAYQYPVLSLADIYSVIGYYLHKRDEIDGYIKERDKIREQVQSKNEARFSSADIRKRLMARQ
jgi:uncharacterized protein (DUF433 family)